MGQFACRACGGRTGSVVLDLGEQPAADYFPSHDDAGPDPVYPLQMWLCDSCGLAQLLEDPTLPEEVKGAEPAALAEQAIDAVERVSEAGWITPGTRVAEFGSPHGGSWLPALESRGVIVAGQGEVADVVLDCFGMMHEPDQAAALSARAARVAPGGVLLIQYHSLDTIIRLGQWNALRHGHFAYYSTTALVKMLDLVGFGAVGAWQFELYGGTILLAASRRADAAPSRASVEMAPSGMVLPGPLLEEDARVGVQDPTVLKSLQGQVQDRAAAVHDWLAGQRRAGSHVIGYGAASRAVTLLIEARVHRDLLPCIVDASPAKHGLRMPGTEIPIVAPARLASERPASVLLFIPDLLSEVKTAFPEIEATGGRWVDAESLGG